MLFTESYVSISQSLKLLIWAVHCRGKKSIQHSKEKNFKIEGEREREAEKRKCRVHEVFSAGAVLEYFITYLRRQWHGL